MNLRSALKLRRSPLGNVAVSALRALAGGAAFDYSGLAMAPLLPPAMAPRVPAPLLSVSESGRRRRPSARSRRLLLSSNSAAAILSKQKSRAPRQDTGSANAARGERPGGKSGADNSRNTLGLSRATRAAVR